MRSGAGRLLAKLDYGQNSIPACAGDCLRDSRRAKRRCGRRQCANTERSRTTLRGGQICSGRTVLIRKDRLLPRPAIRRFDGHRLSLANEPAAQPSRLETCCAAARSRSGASGCRSCSTKFAGMGVFVPYSAGQLLGR